MKISLSALFLMLLALSACTKDKVPIPEAPSYYQPKGNFLILQVSDTLEGIYEYNLPNTALPNDSLPLVWSHFDDGIQVSSHLHFFPNSDTLLTVKGNYFNFSDPFIKSVSLEQLDAAFVPSQSVFQEMGGPLNIDPEIIWSKIALFDIVQKYRASKPNSKIAILRASINVYNSELGISFPEFKYFVFIAR
ncbi:MAG: hypothetical protein ACKOWW_09535 [Flavobacteriales bacterium]